MNIRALLAEAVGTYVLVLFGTLGVATVAIITEGQGSPLVTSLIVPFGFGLGLLAAIAIAGHVSGGHFNPAVTLGALLDGRVTWQSAAGYVVAQIVGAIVASLTIVFVASSAVVTMSVNQPGPTATDVLGRELHAFAIEAVLTAAFVAVILTITRTAPRQGILVIPLTLLAIHFVGIPISGASVNPVRSLAPAVVTGTYASLWVYLTAPFLGAIVGWGIYRILTPPDDEVSVEIEEELDEDDFDDLEEDDEE
jgi:aquaporin Z